MALSLLAAINSGILGWIELHGKKEIGGEGEEAVEAREEGNGSRGKGRRAGLDYFVQCNGHCFGRPKLF